MAEFQILNLGKLQLREVPIEHLYLDPNNPRFMGVESKNLTPQDKCALPKVQQRAVENMKNYGIGDLRDNIAEVGFLPIDKMVFAEIEGRPNEYYALEGNRRLAAVKWLLDDHEAGEVVLRPEILDSLKSLEVYVLVDVKDLQRAQEIIQGIRHMSGIRDWRPYQKAKVYAGLISEGETADKIGRMFGTNTQTVMRYYRAFLAFEEFKNDDTYGQYWDVELFRMFDDVMRRPRLRVDWLGWDETQRKFKNVTELEYFYKWIIYEPETKERKIPGANYIKDLDEVVSNAAALEYLKNEGSTLASALAMVRDKPETSWTSKIEIALRTLKEIAVSELEKLGPEDEQKLTELQREITKTLERSRKLR
ncbi:MAG: hypothetical protein HY665_05235 [Chloroflexi bacterium]|nr:hypothetical protein [Chloroflexota bacterium]